MNTDAFNRRDVMRLLTLTMTGIILLPNLTMADPLIKLKPVFILIGEGKKGKMGN